VHYQFVKAGEMMRAARIMREQSFRANMGCLTASPSSPWVITTVAGEWLLKRWSLAIAHLPTD
jgi:hypothetical protein